MMKQLNKVRQMTGVRPGFGSAGRAGGTNVERRAAAPMNTSFGDVGKACERWLLKNDSEYRKQRELRQRQDAERKERKTNQVGGGR
jgi:hypothetical protein